MRQSSVTRLFAAIALQSVSAHASQLADKNAIRSFEDQQAVAWNAHDAKRYAALFEPNADLVDVYGAHWGSREQIENKLTEKFSTQFAQSQLQIVDVAVRFLTPGIAVVHVAWRMRGATGPGGGQVGGGPSEGLQTQTLVKRQGSWRIAAMQNTVWSPEEIWIVCAPPPPDLETGPRAAKFVPADRRKTSTNGGQGCGRRS